LKNGRIAIPSVGNGGLRGHRSEHFGHCDSFTLVDIKDGKIENVTVVNNGDHQEGGCMVPVNALSKLKVDALVVAGIGARPLMGFNQVGIDVYIDQINPQIKPVVDDLITDNLSVITPGQTCGGGGNHGNGCDHSHDS
jgi:predicted Fe-Mo cluster-binding NifX family protein